MARKSSWTKTHRSTWVISLLLVGVDHALSEPREVDILVVQGALHQVGAGVRAGCVAGTRAALVEAIAAQEMFSLL